MENSTRCRVFVVSSYRMMLLLYGYTKHKFQGGVQICPNDDSFAGDSGAARSLVSYMYGLAGVSAGQTI